MASRSYHPWLIYDYRLYATVTSDKRPVHFPDFPRRRVHFIGYDTRLYGSSGEPCITQTEKMVCTYSHHSTVYYYI